MHAQACMCMQKVPLCLSLSLSLSLSLTGQTGKQKVWACSKRSSFIQSVSQSVIMHDYFIN
jgi:hypothetical protein